MHENSDNLTHWQHHWRAFCCAALSGGGFTASEPITTENNETDFLSFLQAHGLQGILLDALQKSSRQDILSESLSQKLVELRRQALVKELLRKQHLEQFVAILNQAEIKHLILKGTALAYNVYDQAYHRPRIDTDVLIQDKDKQKLHQTLIEHDFDHPITVTGELINHQASYQQHNKGIRHQYDVHWKLSNRNAYANTFYFSELYQEKAQLKDLSHPCFGLSKTDLLLHLNIHYFGHRSDERDRLIWLYDVHQLTKSFSESEWEQTLRQSNKKQLDPLLINMLTQCQTNFSTDIPEAVIKTLTESSISLSDIEQKRLSNENWSRIDQFKSDWNVLNSKQRLVLIKEYIFPKSEFILKQNGSDSRLLLPYYYFKRIIFGAWKIWQGQKKQ